MTGMSGEAEGPAGRADVAREDRVDATGAVTDLFREHHLELVRLALVMVGDLATAEDVVQDAFERLHRGWHGLRQPSSGLAYVRSSVLNGCRSAHRRAAVARKHASQLAEPSPSGPDAASAADDRGELAVALRRLPRRQREVLVLRYYLDLDVAEIADTLRIASSSVRAANTRGLAALARALGEV
jgi:RNA polymerase sigma-70 factor (sigma-E family)